MITIKRSVALGIAAALPLLGLTLTASAQGMSHTGTLQIDLNVHNVYQADHPSYTQTEANFDGTGSLDDADAWSGEEYAYGERVDVTGPVTFTYAPPSDEAIKSTYFAFVQCQGNDDYAYNHYDALYTNLTNPFYISPDLTDDGQDITCTIDVFDGPVLAWDKVDSEPAPLNGTTTAAVSVDLLVGAKFSVKPIAPDKWHAPLPDGSMTESIEVTDDSANNLSSIPGRFMIANVEDDDWFKVTETSGVPGYGTLSSANASQEVQAGRAGDLLPGIGVFVNPPYLSATKSAWVNGVQVGTTTANSVVANGATVMFKIVVSNDKSSGSIYSVVVNDTLPAGMTFVAGSATCTVGTTACATAPSFANGKLTATVGTIGANKEAFVTFQAKVAVANGTFANKAVVSAKSMVDFNTNTVTLSAGKGGTTALPNTGSSVDAGLIGLAASASVLGLGITLVGLRRRVTK